MTRRPLVLYYHGFGHRDAAADPHNLFVETERFAEQLDHLRRAGWTPLDLDGYLAGLERERWPRRSYLLTIDDGYLSTLELAAPMLRDRKVPAVLFMCGGLIGATSRWMASMPHEPLLDATGLRALNEYGVEVAAHGLDHADMVGMDDVELERQTVLTADLLEEAVGYRPRAFAYPSGRFDEPAVAAVARTGYSAGFTVNVPVASESRHCLPRVGVNATDTLRTFALKTHPWWPRAVRLGRRAPRLRAAAHAMLGRDR
jgi:peptidoglycan/xylan/chitin deacetylase (PgdA/CDA1 family)